MLMNKNNCLIMSNDNSLCLLITNGSLLSCDYLSLNAESASCLGANMYSCHFESRATTVSLRLTEVWSQHTNQSGHS